MAKRENLTNGLGCEKMTNDLDEWITLKLPFPELESSAFPTNEGAKNVRQQLIEDCSNSQLLRIITGYSGLDQVVWFVSRYAKKSKIEIVFGSEPKLSNESRLPRRTLKLSEEVRDYWLERGLSPKTNSSILETIKAIESKRVSVRLHTERFLHAKAYSTDSAATFGSSNFSAPGLELSRELNGRFTSNEPRYQAINKFIDGCWNRADDYNQTLLDLLKQLQLHATWREALARSCAALLEGDWAQDLIPDSLKSEFETLWPHQKQGIAQALTVLETQGAVVVADPTGSGKTKTGGWLIRLAYQRMLSKGGVHTASLIPVIVSPSSVENNWYQILDDVGVPREVLSQGILSNPKKESSKRRIELIEKTNLLSVDEIHNYYNLTRNRSKALTTNLAESRIFMTATPINKDYRDLIQLMNLLGTQDLDRDTFRKLKGLEDKINHLDLTIREDARNSARKLVQQFMVRRTRSELKAIANSRKEEYTVNGISSNYPEYISEEYEISNSKNDENIISKIGELVSRIKGVSRLKELKLSKHDIEMNRPEISYLKARVRGAASLAQWHIWDRLNSSPIALLEVIDGTRKVEEEFGIERAQAGTEGALANTGEAVLPKWELSEGLKSAEEVPKWLYDQTEFDAVKQSEIEAYELISNLIRELTSNRIDSKIKAIEDKFNDGKKVLVFDHCIVSLLYLEKLMQSKNVPCDLFIGTGGQKKKRVQLAEANYGLHSDQSPRVALLSDSMSEGINLQGSSTLIHFSSPTTVRNAEQRAGRVDRMNSLFEEITILYPKRDSISEKMKNHLEERCKLVSDVIGSNLKLPNESIEDVSIDELNLEADEMTTLMGTNKEGLFDAFHQVRELIGETGLISNKDYEEMRTSKARVLSYVGLVKSSKPWCFFVIQTNKKWAPQWVFLDFDKKQGKDSRGITTNIDDICSKLTNNLHSAEDVQPSTHADEWVARYLEHVEENEYQLLPMRRKAILGQMNEVLNEWQKKVGYHTEIGEELTLLKMAAISKGSYRLDLRQLAAVWNDWYREYKTVLNVSQTTTRRKKKQLLDLIKENPPSNMKQFISRFEKINSMEAIDPRTIAMIAGVPPYI